MTHLDRAFVAWITTGTIVGLVAVACHGPPAQTAADVMLDATYAAELQGCLDKGKAAHSRAVYARCADDVDRRWSADGGAR